MGAMERRAPRCADEGGLVHLNGWPRKALNTFTSEQRPEGGEKGPAWLSLGRESKAEGTASTKALGLQSAWCVPRAGSRPVWLEGSGQRGKAGVD